MALAPAIVGAKRPSQTITWTDQDGDAFTLTGATITARIRRNGVGVASDGTFTVTGTNTFRWDYSTADVAEAGLFEVQFNAAFGSNPTPARTIKAIWTVYEAI